MQTRNSPSIITLHSLARQASIPDFATLPKPILYKKLQESFDFDRLQRAESRRRRLQEITASKKRSLEADGPSTTTTRSKRSCTQKKVEQLNKLDPIMRFPVGKTNTWKFIRPNGGAVVFNVESLVDYLLATGDFTDPESRIQFSDKDLKEIDELVVKAGLKKRSVYCARKDPHAFDDLKFRRDGLQGLERCAGETITDILNIIETCDPDEAQMRLIMRELPTFSDYYRQLREADAPFAKQCMVTWRQYLEGPPNRPNEDLYGLIEVVCHFLKMCEPSFVHSAHHTAVAVAGGASAPSSGAAGGSSGVLGVRGRVSASHASSSHSSIHSSHSTAASASSVASSSSSSSSSAGASLTDTVPVPRATPRILAAASGSSGEPGFHFFDDDDDEDDVYEDVDDDEDEDDDDEVR